MIRDRTRNFALLAAVSALMGVGSSARGNRIEEQDSQTNGHRSVTRKHNLTCGRDAKRAEKHRRRITRRNSR